MLRIHSVRTGIFCRTSDGLKKTRMYSSISTPSAPYRSQISSITLSRSSLTSALAKSKAVAVYGFIGVFLADHHVRVLVLELADGVVAPLRRARIVDTDAPEHPYAFFVRPCRR